MTLQHISHFPCSENHIYWCFLYIFLATFFPNQEMAKNIWHSQTANLGLKSETASSGVLGASSRYEYFLKLYSMVDLVFFSWVFTNPNSSPCFEKKLEMQLLNPLLWFRSQFLRSWRKFGRGNWRFYRSRLICVKIVVVHWGMDKINICLFILVYGVCESTFNTHIMYFYLKLKSD